MSFAKKTDKSKIASVWKIENDDVDEDIIDADNLLDEEDKVKPDPASLKGNQTNFFNLLFKLILDLW